MKNETIMKIAVCGRSHSIHNPQGTSLCEVEGEYFCAWKSGQTLMIEIACAAIIAAMTDILDQQREAEIFGDRTKPGVEVVAPGVAWVKPAPPVRWKKR